MTSPKFKCNVSSKIRYQVRAKSKVPSIMVSVNHWFVNSKFNIFVVIMYMLSWNKVLSTKTCFNKEIPKMLIVPGWDLGLNSYKNQGQCSHVWVSCTCGK